MGSKSLNEIKEILSEMGLSLGSKIDAASPMEVQSQSNLEPRGTLCDIEKKDDNLDGKRNIDGRCSGTW